MTIAQAAAEQRRIRRALADKMHDFIKELEADTQRYYQDRDILRRQTQESTTHEIALQLETLRILHQKIGEYVPPW